MLSQKCYDPNNIRKARYAQTAVVVGSIVVCGYLVFTSVYSIRQVWSAERALSIAKKEAAELSRQAAIRQRQDAQRQAPRTGGVDSFAVTLADWARACDVFIESFAPEGTAVAGEVQSDGVKLGTWNANRVRVKGRGGYEQLLALLDDFRTTSEPVRLESFSLQASQTDAHTTIDFELLLTVYEKKAGTS